MGLGYALAPGKYAGRDSDKGESIAPYKRTGNHCYLCCFVRIDMMDRLPRLELASATLGYEAPGSRRGTKWTHIGRGKRGELLHFLKVHTCTIPIPTDIDPIDDLTKASFFMVTS